MVEQYRQYRELACAIIHDGIRQYKKAMREGYDLEVPRKYLKNDFFELLVSHILNCSVDDMLDKLEENYKYEKYSGKRY